MPRYLVECLIPHASELTIGDLQAITRQCLRVQQEMEAEIQWLHSALTAGQMICLYSAADEALVREHARRSGLPIHRISEVSAVIGPTMNDQSQESSGAKK